MEQIPLSFETLMAYVHRTSKFILIFEFRIAVTGVKPGSSR